MTSESSFIFTHEEKKGGIFLRLFSMPQASVEKISQTFNHAFVRYYSRAGLSIAYLMQETGFKTWFNREPTFRVYGVIQEGDFQFLDPLHNTKPITHDLIRYEYGPRQYLQSFSAFSIYCPINFFGLVATTNSFTSTRNGLAHALEEARLDLSSGACKQVLIAGSLPERPNTLFYLVTNDLSYLTQSLFQKLDKI